MNINATRVKQLRAERLWSQEQLSEACGLNLRTIPRLENTGKASLETVKALAAVFEIDAQELLINEPGQITTPLKAIRAGFEQFANFSDQTTRFDYWWFVFFVAFVSAVAGALHLALFQAVSVIVFLPLIAAGTRRLNEVNLSGWWQLLSLVPFGIVVVLYMLAMKPKVGRPLAGSKGMDVA